VLHRLCDRLNVAFANVRETPVCYLMDWVRARSNNSFEIPGFRVNPAYKTPVLPPWMDARRGIALYPESVFANPLGVSRVVHWILYFPGGNGGSAAEHYDPADLIACFSPGFCSGFDPSLFHMTPLRVVDYEFAHFLNLRTPAGGRSGAMTFGRKKTFHSAQAGSIPINGTLPVPENPLPDGDKRARLKHFARLDRFYSTDPATFRSVEAAMAGATSIVMPVPGVSKSEWLASVGDEFRFGVAYGEDDIPHARQTLPCVLPMLRRKAAQERDQIRRFVRDTASYFDQRDGVEAGGAGRPASPGIQAQAQHAGRRGRSRWVRPTVGQGLERRASVRG
jgi:hypothetical protein